MFKYFTHLLPKLYYQYSINLIRKQFFTMSFSTLSERNKQILDTDSYVWIDMEMTGLDPAKDTVLEVACIVTTPELKPVGDAFDVIIHQSDEILNSMNEWSLQHHALSGLTESSRKSNISLSEADDQLTKYILEHSKGVRYLAGNSVYMDRLFLMKYFPKANDCLHYRIIDVTSIKLLCEHWYPNKFSTLKKKTLAHRALSDIKESIEELQNLRNEFFVK